jgi:hypothetical protein
MLTAKQAKEAMGARGGAEGGQQPQIKKDVPVLLLSAKQLEREAQQQPEQLCMPPPVQLPRPSLPVAKIDLTLGSLPLVLRPLIAPLFIALNPFPSFCDFQEANPPCP